MEDRKNLLKLTEGGKEKRTRLFLVRHGEIQGERKYIGHLDVDLTPQGIEQMERIRERLQNEEIQAIYSSDLRRAKKGAEIIAKPHELRVESFPQFREVNLGTWEGLSIEEIAGRYPEDFQRRLKDIVNFVVPQGESLKDLERRARKKLRDLLKKWAGENIVLVAHGGVNRVILCRALGLKLENLFRLGQDYGCLNIIDYYEDTTVVKLLNG